MAMPKISNGKKPLRASGARVAREAAPPPTEYSGRPVLIVADPVMMANAYAEERMHGRVFSVWRDHILELKSNDYHVWDEIVPHDIMVRDVYDFLLSCYRNAGHNKIVPFGQPKASVVSNVIRHVKMVLPYLASGPRCGLAKPYKSPQKVAA